MKLSRRAGRPSPAMLLAAVALVFAMVGTAVAGPGAIISKVKQSQVRQIAIKQAKKQITKQAPTFSRSAFSQIAANALVGPIGPAVVRTATIVAPGTGYLLVNAGSDVVETGNASFTGACAIRVDGVVITSSNRTWHVNAAGGTNPEEDCTTETTAQIAPGTHTVDLYAVNGLNATTRYNAAELQILYVPFGATGTQP